MTRDPLRPSSARSPASAIHLAAVLALLLVAGCAAERQETSERAVNRSGPLHTVLICIDTVRYDSFWLPGGDGPADELTAWTENAARFRRAQATGPWTIPSVGSVLTGFYPPRHAAGRFEAEVANLDVQVPTALADGLPVLADVLEEAGVATAAFTAHPWFGPKFELGQGFGELSMVKSHEKITARGLAWLAKQRADEPERPTFLYLHFMESHEMHRGSKEEVEEVVGALDEGLRAAALEAAPGELCARPDSLPCQRYLAYVRSVTLLRDNLAGLLSELEARGALDDTAVVVYSDHGEEFEDHEAEETRWAADPRGFYGSGHGQSLFQELLHVPLVMWHPDLEGRDVEAPVSLIDVFPTILAAAGAEPGDGRRRLGRELAELAVAPEGRGLDRPLFASGIAYGPQQSSVLRWPWKRIVRQGTGERFLYNLEDDPLEMSPVTESEGPVAELDGLLSGYSRLEPVLASEAPSMGEEDLDNLRSLGYLGGARADQEPE
jgi:arylsulfatase A-like enzyme